MHPKTLRIAFLLGLLAGCGPKTPPPPAAAAQPAAQAVISAAAGGTLGYYRAVSTRAYSAQGLIALGEKDARVR